VFAPISRDVERSFKHFRYPARYLFRESKGRIQTYPDLRGGELVTATLDTPWNRIKALLIHARFTGAGVERIYQAAWPADGIEEALTVVALARRVAEERGARFALLFLPHPEECLSQQYRVDVSAFAFPDLKHYFPRDPEGVAAIHFANDQHWNERGHAMAARAVVGALLSEGVLRPSDVVAKAPPSVVGG
jgi:hypothetical protein